MSFESQKKKAFAKTQNVKWAKQQRQYAPGRPQFGTDGSDYMLDRGVTAAYSNKSGYSIQTNPFTGDKEMYVRGTTFKGGGREWASNVLEAPAVGLIAPELAGFSLKKRKAHADKLSKIAIEKGVKVIYGHSRGATLVADMKVPGAKRVGLDGALLLADRGKKGMVNYRQKQLFDAVIGIGAEKTTRKKGWVPVWNSKYHKVWK